MARVIAVASGKGGVGKTTVAINIGTVLAHKFKKNVTLIDTNVTTSHLGMYLGIYYSPVTLNKVLRGEVPMKEAVYHHIGNLKVIPASLSISDLEGVDVTKLREKIDVIAGDNEIILLDGAPGLGRESVASLKAADEVLFVTTPYVPAVMDVIRTMEIVNEIGIKPIGIVLNMVNKDKHEMTPQEVEQLTRLPVISSIPYDKSVNKSLVEKLPVVIHKQNSKASKAYTELAAGLIGYSTEKPSLLSRVIGRIRGRRKMEAQPSIPENAAMRDQMMMRLPTQPQLHQNTRAANPIVPMNTLPPPGFPSPDGEIERPRMPGPDMQTPDVDVNIEKNPLIDE